MAIVGSAQERPDSPTIDGNLNQRKYTRKFLVQTDSVTTGPLQVGSAPGLPLLYSAYVFNGEFDRYALVRNITCERVQPASLYWEVTVRYETPEPSEDKNTPSGAEREKPGENDNPLLAWPEVETSTEKFPQVIFGVYDIKTRKFVPCKNSAGQVFDPPPTRDSSRLILTITRNEPIDTPHPSVDIQYIDTVNADVFWGCPPGTWKVMSISTTRQTKQTSTGGIIPYLKCAYKFEARGPQVAPGDNWDLQILDAGSYFLATVDVAGTGPVQKKIPFIDDAGHPRSGPLNGSGANLFDEYGGKFKGTGNGTTGVYLQYRVYPRVAFAGLQLPQSFLQIA